MKKNGWLSQCQLCGKEIYVTPCKQRNGRGKYCSRSCTSKVSILTVLKVRNEEKRLKSLSKAMINLFKDKTKHPRWRGGKFYHTDGYVYTSSPNHPHKNKDGYVFEHRLVMEQHINRLLDINEQIHHINGIKDDNRIENLEITNASEHIKKHPEIMAKAKLY